MAPLRQYESIDFVISLIVCVASICILVFVCACCKKRRQPRRDVSAKMAKQQQHPRVIGGVGDRYEQVTTGFAVNMLRVVTTPTTVGARAPSCVFSPYALQATFGVCLLGADSKTQVEMTETLFPNAGTSTYAEDVMKEMIESAKTARDRNLFRVLLRVYAHSGQRYSSEFRKTIQKDFGTKPFVTVNYAKMSSEEMAKTTHQWLATVTRNQLTEFVSTTWRPIDEKKSSLCVVSAASLDCAWKQPFYDHHSRNDKPFFMAAGKSIKIDMMRQTNTFGYCENEQMQTIRMEYADSNMALYVFLPRVVSGLETLEKKLTPDYILATCKAAMQRQQLLDVWLPRFRMECEIGDPLVIALANLGLATSFKKGEADFSHILDETVDDQHALWISGAVHKAMIEFADEPSQRQVLSGQSNPSVKSLTVSHVTTASGSSAASFKSIKGGVETFVADHPFVFLIVLEPKMTPLFYGRFCGV